MPFEKGNKLGGRPKGSKNKILYTLVVGLAYQSLKFLIILMSFQTLPTKTLLFQ